VPWPPFFAIWAVIFALSFGFAAWQALPQNLADPLLRKLGWFAIAAWALNTAWEWHVPRRDLDWTSVALIAAALAVLLGAVATIRAAEVPLDGWRFWLGVAPLQLLAGWISAATWVNLGSTLKWSGVTVRTSWQLGLLLVAGGLGAVIAAFSGSLVYAGPIVWALLGIVIHNIVRDRNLVLGGTAAILAPIVLVAAVAS
jgi:hypothetical protein